MKWIGRILFFGFLVFVVGIITVGAVSYFYSKGLQPPPVDKARYGLQTFSQDGMMIPSRVYYTNSVIIKDGKPVITDYWILDGSRFKQKSDKDGKELPANTKIVRRQ